MAEGIFGVSGMKNGSFTLCPFIAGLSNVFPDGNLRMSKEKTMIHMISVLSTLNSATS